MSFKNVMNLVTVEVKGNNKKVPHYDIKSSVQSSAEMGAKQLSFDVKELEPGQLSYPYHYHSNSEEVFIIIEGEVTLRQNDKTTILTNGDLAFFENSEEGAHQLFNHTNKTVRYLDLSAQNGQDVCKYPDSNKINVGKGDIYKMESKVDYYEGEQSVPLFWSQKDNKSNN